VPATAATNEKNEKTSRDKFITCVFPAGVDTKKYGRLKTELNKAYVVRRATMQTSVPMGTAMTSHQLDQV
jgi:hypothetical protein